MTVQPISFRENFVSPPKRVPTQAEIFAEKIAFKPKKPKKNQEKKEVLTTKLRLLQTQ